MYPGRNGAMDDTSVQPEKPNGGGIAAAFGRLHRDEQGATILETGLLIACIALPSYYIMTIALNTLIEHYRMITLVNSLPFP
jgi:Flp pilus assembly pilin Flp